MKLSLVGAEGSVSLSVDLFCRSFVDDADFRWDSVIPRFLTRHWFLMAEQVSLPIFTVQINAD